MRLIDANLIEEIFKEQGYDYCAGVVYCTPTIDAEPIRHGKWLMNDAYGTYCSECGSAAFEITGRHYSKMKTRYCWQCGARMEGAEE